MVLKRDVLWVGSGIHRGVTESRYGAFSAREADIVEVNTIEISMFFKGLRCTTKNRVSYLNDICGPLR